MASQALYYPNIDIRDEAWLKTSVLYWDRVRTIVPEPITQPYQSDVARALCDADHLVPIRVQSEMREIDELAGRVIDWLDSPEGLQVLRPTDSEAQDRPSQRLFSSDFRRNVRMWPEKLPYEIRHVIEELQVRDQRGWFDVDPRFAAFYMTLLATNLANRVGATLVTQLADADALAIAARLDCRGEGSSDRQQRFPPHRRREYDAWDDPVLAPKTLAAGLLGQLAITRIGIDPATPIDRLIDFKHQHRDELQRFRSQIEELARSVETDIPVEALHQCVTDMYEERVVPAISDLRKALEGRRIRWLSEGLLKVAFLSVGPAAALVATGLSVPTALLAGAGISFVATGAMYNVDRREILRQNPYSYLLSMGNALG